MTKDDIMKMAREAGINFRPLDDDYCDMVGLDRGTICRVESIGDEEIKRFATIVAASEREACAQLATQTVCDTHLPTGIKIYGTAAAKAIRARIQK